MEKLNCLRLFRVLNQHSVRFILIGGMNYFLRFRPVSTQVIDVWIEPTIDNSLRCETAILGIQAEWGRSDEDWGPTKLKAAGWLQQQSVYCLLTDSGLVDVVRVVAGLESFDECWQRGESCELEDKTFYRSLSASDMIKCQLAIPEPLRKIDRVNHLRSLLQP